MCADDYRGPSAFSEPETQAMRDFLRSHGDIKLAINWHAYGNNMNIPYNFAESSNTELKSEHPKEYEYFVRLLASAPHDMKLGNRAATSKFKTNGEVSDYMFHERGILAVSPEIGSSNIKSMTYYITERNTTLQMLDSHNKWVIMAAKTLLPSLKIDLDHWSQKKDTYDAQFDITNIGLGQIRNSTIFLQFNQNLF